MKIDCARDPAIFETLQQEWNELLTRCATNTPFQRAEFQRVWWKHLGRGDLCVLVMRHDDNTLAAIAPVFVDPEGGGTVRWVGGEEIADYLDVIAPTDIMAQAARHLWTWLHSPEAPTWSQMILSNMPQWTNTAHELKSLAETAGHGAEVTPIDVCPVIELPNSFEAYLEQIDSKQRREIKRKLRRAEGGDISVNWYVADANRDIAAETEAFITLMASASAQKEAFLTPHIRQTFAELFAVMMNAGLLQLAFFEVEGKKVAAYAQFDYANRVWVYNSGINADDAGGLSPGWVLLAKLIERAINNGRAAYDFMQGNEDYKYRFGGQDTAVYRLAVQR